MSEWISVKTRRPKIKEGRFWPESDRVIVYVVDRRGEGYEAFARYTEGGDPWRIEGHNGAWSEFVTHWMPLPPAPSAQAAQK